MKDWIKEKLQQCKICNYTQLPPPEEVIKALVPDRPRRVWQLDYIGPFPVCCKSGAKYGLVGLDPFSKMVFGSVTFDERWEHVLKTLEENFIVLGGKPDEIQTDNGGPFVADGL